MTLLSNILFALLAYWLGKVQLERDWLRDELDHYDEDEQCRACISIHEMYHKTHREA